MEDVVLLTQFIHSEKLHAALVRDTLDFSHTVSHGDDRLSFTRWCILLGVYPSLPSSPSSGLAGANVAQYAQLCREHIAKLQELGTHLRDSLRRTEHASVGVPEKPTRGKLRFDESSSSDADCPAPADGPLGNNPLKPMEESDYAKEFTVRRIRKEAHKDVDRIFWEPALFDRAQTKKDIEEILILYCVEYGCDYRQGMHEVVALCYYAAHRDADLLRSMADQGLVEDNGTTLMQGVFLSAFDDIIPVVYTVFSLIMSDAICLKDFFFQNVEDENSGVVRCAYTVQHEVLLSLDPSLHRLLNVTYEIESGCYLVRWLRMLFIREFSLFQTIFVWEVLFAECCISRLQQKEYSLHKGFVSALAARMICHMKPTLLRGADAALRCLMKYPRVDTVMPLVESAVLHTEGGIQSYVTYRTALVEGRQGPSSQPLRRQEQPPFMSESKMELYGERLNDVARKLEEYRLANIHGEDAPITLGANELLFYEALAEIKILRDVFLYHIGD